MRTFLNSIACFCLFLALLINNSYAQVSGYKILKKISLPGDGKWDFVTFDKTSRRLYVSHATVMQVVDMEKETLIGEVPKTPGIHGIAIVPELNKGFTSNGKDSTVTIFDLKTLSTIKKIKLSGSNPDHILYDEFSKYVYAFNNKSGNVSVIDPKAEKEIKNIEVGGGLEISVSDGKGLIFVNVEDKNEIAILNTKSLTLKTKWSLLPGEEPTGIAFDSKNNRIFSSCHNKMLVVMNAVTGKVITTLPIGGKVDGAVFDASEKLIFTSNGEGSVTIIRQETADKYSILDNIVTQKGAKTIALDEAKHRVYIPVAEFGTLPAVTPENPEPKAPILPNTFGILVIGK